MEYTVTSGIATLSFDRPERANALALPDWHAMREAFEHADRDTAVKVVILTAQGKHFCAGIDLSVLQSLPQQLDHSQEIRPQLRAFITDLQDCITSIERCRKPVIAAVHGSCIGGGVDIIAACDIRYCTKDANFSIKEVDLGIVADLGTLQRLPRIISPGIAAELSFTARYFNGEEAHRIGLVNEALSNQQQLHDRVAQIADTIAAKAPHVIEGVKRTLLHQREHTVEEGLAFVADYSAGLMGREV